MSETADARRRRLEFVTARLGPWEPPHNIYLGDGVWTITDQQQVENSKLRRVLQVIADQAQTDIAKLRVLDLACEGGVFGIELARQGAEVVAVEGRQVHVDRVRFAATEIGLSNYRVEVNDVRQVTAESHGTFDVVLCLGILYHLDVPDVFSFVHELSRLTSRFMVLDTQVGLEPRLSWTYQDREYSGVAYREHSSGATADERSAKLRASLDNPESVWLTRPSLYNLLADAGFTSVFEARVPRPSELHEDRVTLLASAGSRIDVPGDTSSAPARWPESERLARDRAQTWRGRLARRLDR